MRFWDSSAIVPLCCRQPGAAALMDLLVADDEVVVWRAARVECISALARLEREGAFSDGELRQGREVPYAMSDRWSEVSATPAVRENAEQLLQRHPLRAADSVQLAAALVWRAGPKSGFTLVTLDERLREAGSGEGFATLP